MKALLFWCLMALLVGLPIYCLYWYLFRAVLIKRLTYHLFQIRDDLRMLLISGAIVDKKAYPLLETFCNRAITKIDRVDFATIFSRKLDKTTKLEVERDLAIIFESGVDMRKLFLKTNFVIFGAAAANSPGALILISPLVIFAVTALWFNKVRNFLIELIKKGVGNLFLTPGPAGC